MAEMTGTGMGSPLAALMQQYLDQTTPRMRSGAMGYFNPQSGYFMDGYEPDLYMLPPQQAMPPSILPFFQQWMGQSPLNPSEQQA